MTLAQRVISQYAPEINSIFGNDAPRATALLEECESRSYVEGRIFCVEKCIRVYSHLADARVRRSLSLVKLLEAELRPEAPVVAMHEKSEHRELQIREGLEYLDRLRCRHNPHAYFPKPRLKKPGIPKATFTH